MKITRQATAVLAVAAFVFTIAACLQPAPLKPSEHADPTPAVPAKYATVPILIYHSVRDYVARDSANSRRFIITPATLEAELKFLKDKGYVSIGFDDLADHIERGRPLPEPSVIISFDDGWGSEYKRAFPLLQKYGFRATFFIFTNSIGKKYFMSLEDLRALLKAGMWIGSHSLTHPYLTKIKDPAALRRQIFESKRILEEKLGTPITSFAYPFGQFNPAIEALVREAGYRTARGTSFGIRHSAADLLALTGLIDVTVVDRIDADLMAALKEEAKERPAVPPPGIDPGEYD